MKGVRAYEVSSRLISIDGPDGTGKSTLSALLTTRLQVVFEPVRVMLVKPTYFGISPRASQIGKDFSRIAGHLAPDSQEHNSFFLAAFRANFEDVVMPALAEGQIVVLDSSELRALAFVMARCCPEAISITKQEIVIQKLTGGILPRTRVTLLGEPKEIWKNLCTKQVLDKGDPRDLSEVELRIKAYREAMLFLREHYSGEGLDWVNVNICHSQSNLLVYLAKIIETEIWQKLVTNLSG